MAIFDNFLRRTFIFSLFSLITNVYLTLLRSLAHFANRTFISLENFSFELN